MSPFRTRLLSIADPDDAHRELTAVGVDLGGISMMSSKMQTRCIKLYDITCRQANILKQEMLSLGGDAAVARGTVACSIPATDVILIGTDKQLQNLCLKLPMQPFGLASLVPKLQETLALFHARPLFWKTSRRTFSLERPLIMGILNITPDSFSDGNRYIDPQRAVEQGIRMAADGADIIDIGGESSRPGAVMVSMEEECARILPVIKALHQAIPCALSVDTWKSNVACQAIDAGAEIINDISGFTFDSDMARIAADTGAGSVLMHTRGTPRTMQQQTDYRDLVGDICDALATCVETAVASGVERDCIAVDPGIGFAKQTHHNLKILRHLSEFSVLGLPLLVGTSRKSFIGKTIHRETDDRLFGTAATVALAVSQGARILRVHDVREMRDVADMAHSIATSTF